MSGHDREMQPIDFAVQGEYSNDDNFCVFRLFPCFGQMSAFQTIAKWFETCLNRLPQDSEKI